MSAPKFVSGSSGVFANLVFVLNGSQTGFKPKRFDVEVSQNRGPLLDGFEGKPKETTYLEGFLILTNIHVLPMTPITASTKPGIHEQM